MASLTYTTGGDNNVTSFKAASSVPITSLKAYFKPKQDFNGYDKPWIGGGGKNLFNWNVPQQNPDNITGSNTSKRIFTPGTYFLGSSYSNYWGADRVTSYSIENGNITVDARSGYGIGFALSVSEGNYYISSTSSVGNGVVNVTLYQTDGTAIILNNGGTIRSITVPEDVNIMVITFRNYSNGTPDTFSNIQVEKGTVGTSYEPFENICPIEGWNELSISHAGKNLGTIKQVVEGRPYTEVTLDGKSCIDIQASGTTPENLYKAFKPNT